MLPSPVKMAEPSAPQLNLFAPADELFPLPLTPFEKLFVQDDSPAFPIHFFCRLRFNGRLQQDTLKKALGVALCVTRF